MKNYYILLFSSILYTLIVAIFADTLPFPTGTYTAIRYRLSSDEPNAIIATKVEISSDGNVSQLLTIKDDSMTSHAAFKFDGYIDDCLHYKCEYVRTGDSILKSEMKNTLFESKYLDLIAKSKGKDYWQSTIELIYKDNDVVIFLEKDTDTPRLYAFNGESH